MHYCISDIHGEYDRYAAMLELINFSDEDTLFVIGDAIDRKPDGVKILRDIMSRPNVHMILGNHELLALNDLLWHYHDANRLWHDNGGSRTRRELLYKCTAEERIRILSFLRKLPDHLDVEVNGRRFHLVHGYPADNTDDRVWLRPELGAPAPMPGVTVIIGHTPTCFLRDDDGSPFRIWYGDGIIDIDCGCGNTTELRRLACLRIDDMAEFYT